MSIVKGVIFDKDGTLFDFASTWESWSASLLTRLTDSPEAAAHLGRQIGFDTTNQRFAPDSLVIAGTAGEVTNALLPHVPGYTFKTLSQLLNDEAARAPQVEVVPLVPFLEGLRARGLKLGVATNDSEAPARAHLAGAQVTGLFDFIAGFDSGFGGKPAPGQLLGFAQAQGLAPSEIVMVGDSTHDLMAARAAGMRAVAVLTGMADHAALAPFADVVLADIGALPTWLDLEIGPDKPLG